MIGLTARRRDVPMVDRSRDRVVVLVAVALAVGFLSFAAISALLPEALRRGAWLPLHLALAGGATTAIAGVMPFFSAAFAAAQPAAFPLRLGAVLTVALGALAVAFGVMAASSPVAVAGGILFVAGIALIAAATMSPLHGALGPSRGIVIQGYVVALTEVGVGATIATLYVAGWAPLLTTWSSVKPAHAWLNLVGFVSLVIATTLLHFFPTVVGARMAARPSARVTVVGLAAGPAIVALAFAFKLDVLGRFGALVVLFGAAGLGVYALRTWGSRARWTTDKPWHLFSIGGLISAMVWFWIGTAIAAGRVLVMGTAPATWSLDAVFGPLVAGWIGLTLLASASHLLPAIGPGGPAAHARQRSILGRFAVARLSLADLGVAALSMGLLLRVDELVVAGFVLASASLAATGVLIVAAISIGFRGTSTPVKGTA